MCSMLQHDVLKTKIAKPTQVLNELHSNIPSARSHENDQVNFMSFYQVAFFTPYTNIYFYFRNQIIWIP